MKFIRTSDGRLTLVSISEAALLEKTKDKEGRVWDVVIIKEGYSKNIDPETKFPRYYPAETLKDMIPLFEGCGVFAYGYKSEEVGKDFDHIPANVREVVPEGLAGNVVGWLENVRFVENFEGGSGALVGSFHCASVWLREKLLDSWDAGKKDLLGFSIDIEGKTQNGLVDGKPSNVVVKATKANELTVVTNPAAGGKLFRLVASMKGYEMEWIKKMFARLAEGRPEVGALSDEHKTADYLKNFFGGLKVAEGENRTAESDQLSEDMKALLQAVAEAVTNGKGEEAVEMLNKLIESYGHPVFIESLNSYGYKYPEAPAKPAAAPAPAPAPAASPAPAPAPAPAAPAVDGVDPARVAALENEIAVQKCEKVLDGSLEAEETIPEAVKENIRADYEGKVFEPEALKKRIEREKNVLAKLTESGKIKGLGGDGVEVTLDKTDKIERKMELMLDPELKTEDPARYEGLTPFGLKESYVACTGDVSVRGIVDKSRLTEATTSDYPITLSNIMTKRLAKEYKRMSGNWEKISSVVPADNFKENELIRIGGFTELQDVTEDQDFPDMVAPFEEKAVYTVGQKGGTYYVTRKMIINDDLRSVRQIPTKMSRAAHNTLDNFCFRILIGWGGSPAAINGATIYDGKPLYDADHFNLGTDAMAYDSLNAMIDRMLSQWEYGAKNALNGAIDDSVTTVTVDDGSKFKEGDMILVEAEIMYVSAVSTNDLTVERGYDGTTAAAHADNSIVYTLVEQLGISPAYCVAPIDLRETLEQFVNNPEKPGTTNRDFNNLKGRFEPIIVPKHKLGGSATNFYGVASPSEIESIVLAFLNGRTEPEILVQDQPTVGEVFKKQRITYRILHEYTGVPADFRGVDGNII